MFRALSPFTLSDSYDGVLLGNLVANAAIFGLHVVVVGVVSLVKAIPLRESVVVARFPSVYLQLGWMLTFGSNAFAALQLLTGDNGDGSSTSSPDTMTVALAAVVLVVFNVVGPCALMLYIYRNVKAYYQVYEYHKWRRGETGLRVRLLSTFLLPIGRWEPTEVRRCLGPMVTLQCRHEYGWVLFPLISPTLVALFSLVRNESDVLCMWVYVVLGLLHLALVLVVVVCKPFRSMIEDWFAAGALLVTSIYLFFAAINLKYPGSAAIAVVLAAFGVLQLVVMAVRFVYHVAHIFIARRLAETVPQRLLFEWYCGKARLEKDVLEEHQKYRGEFGSDQKPQGLLLDELEALMLEGDDGACEIELHSIDVLGRSGGGMEGEKEFVPLPIRTNWDAPQRPGELLADDDNADDDEAQMNFLLFGDNTRETRGNDLLLR